MWGTAMIVFDKLWETMSQRQISTYVRRKKYNVESRTIRRLTANQNVTTDTHKRLCRIVDCDLNDQIQRIRLGLTGTHRCCRLSL